LASPGSPSISTCPSARRAMSRRSIAASWPMIDSPMRFFNSRMESREGITPPFESPPTVRVQGCEGSRLKSAPGAPRGVTRNAPTHDASSRFQVFQFLEPLQCVLLSQQSVTDAGGIERTARLVRKPVEAREELLDLALNGNEQPHLLREELHRLTALLESALVRVHAEVGDNRPSGHLSGGGRDVALLLGEAQLPVVPANCVEVS